MYSALVALAVLLCSVSAWPANFSWSSSAGVNYVGVAMNQNYPRRCESGWALGTIAMLNVRLGIRMRSSSFERVSLSAQVLLSCDTLNLNCYGGEPLQALRWIRRNFITDDSCSSYQAQATTCDSRAKCATCVGGRCGGQSHSKLYAVRDYGAVSGEGAMLDEILQYGPVVCGIAFADDIKYGYKGGVYRGSATDTKINHYVMVYGWGVEGGVKYWQAINSFGPAWGEEGGFRIVRGENMLGIQSLCYWGNVVDTWTNDQRNQTLPNGMQDKEQDKEQGRKYPKEYPKEYPYTQIIGDYWSPTRNMYSVKDCNASWAFATLQMLSDRLYKESKGLLRKVFSVQALLNCGVGTCSAGDAFEVLNFVKRLGVPEEGCQPYRGQNPVKVSCDGLSNCGNCIGNSILKQNCSQFKGYRRWKIGEFGVVNTIESMKGAIDVDGPIVCEIELTAAFREYKGGVFSEVGVAVKPNHFVEIVAYKGAEYWVGREAFGSAWGVSGYFQIKMGGNNLGLEKKCYYAKHIA